MPEDTRNGLRDQATSIVFEGADAVTAIRVQTLSDAKSSINICDDSVGTVALVHFEPVYSTLLKAAERRNVPIRFITDVRKDNLAPCKQVTRFAELRHLEGVKGNFVVTDSAYYAFAEIKESKIPVQAIHSRAKIIVEQQQYLFDTLWNSAIPAKIKIRELEEGIEPQETRVIEDFSEVLRIGQEMTQDLKREALILAASENTIIRNRSLYQDLSRRQEKLGFRVRILCPSISNSMREVLPHAEWRQVDPTSVSVTIYDGERMFITQYADPRAKSAEKAIASNIYSNNKQTILGMVSVFEALWRESELRDSEEKSKRKLAETLEKEERSRRQAQLLQDILTHDIRNYNQVSKLSAELLKEKFSSDPEAQTLVDSLLQAIDGSTSLVERGRRLGRILTEEDVQLYPINLVESLRRSLSLLKLGNKERVIEDEIVLPKSTKENTIRAQADDLIDEVFSNIFTNSLKYTDGPSVPLKIEVNGEVEHWKVSITDRGTGIPDEMLQKVYDRYLAGAKGSGLGMSIVHSLVVQRYHGGLEINSSQDPVSHGTTIHIWLRKG